MEPDVKAVVNTTEVLPPLESLERARTELVNTLPDEGHGLAWTQTHLNHDIVPAFDRHSKSPNYYGFVTGGTTPAALMADHIVAETDQSPQVYLPKDSIAVEVEDRALHMLCELFDLIPDKWPHRTLTTGATASNIVGLACGREFVLQKAATSIGVKADISVADDGISEAMRKAGIERIQVLTTVPHSSLRKAASVVGLGRSSVRDVSLARAPHKFDMDALESSMNESKVASIVAVSCAEVNTGFFATNGNEMQQIRRLCDRYGAWLHVDAAFGLLARVLPRTKDCETLVQGVSGLELADSITGDAHKLLNVPYDCGIFLSRHLPLGTHVFQNTNAVYLTPSTSSSTPPAIPSPLNIGLENSRRLRALPVYATLAAYGRDGYRDMLERQVRLARAIAAYIVASPSYDLLPEGNDSAGDIFIIVLFRARDPKVNTELVQRVNASRKIYVSGTQWQGEPAARFAVASWQVVVEREMATIRSVLEEAVR